MVLPKIYIPKLLPSVINRGFTLIEVIVVVAIMLLVLSSSLFFTTSQLQRESLASQRRQLVTALQTARAEAMNNVRQTPHGVALYPPGIAGYVIFTGPDYAHRELETQTVMLTNYPITRSSSTPAEIIFNQLSGESSFDGEIILWDQRNTASTSIIVNSEGGIGW